jgi:methionine biosynthesis protein MetW
MTAAPRILGPLRTVQRPSGPVRDDFRMIVGLIEPGTRVLDVGCEDGRLLELLVQEKGVDGRGIELSMAGVHTAVSHGLSVIQGDADTDLDDYPSAAFDYVVLSQTIQATRDPRGVLDNLVRIGRRAIVSLPNFGYWRIRMQLLLNGRMPRTWQLGHEWWETPNIHLCTLTDFEDLCDRLGIVIETRRILGRGGARRTPMMPNLLAEQAVYLLSRR